MGAKQSKKKKDNIKKETKTEKTIKEENKNIEENKTKIKINKKSHIYAEKEEEDNEEIEKEEEKIIIDEFSKELKIHPKKIKDLDKNTFDKLEKFFNDYKCSKCFKKIIVNIERNKEDNILNIISKCKNNHIETKPIFQFLEENKFSIDEKFKLYDFVPLDIRKKEKPEKRKRFDRWDYSYHYYDEYPYREDESYFICFKCKKILDLKKSLFEKISHEHNLFEYYIIGGGDRDYYGYSEHVFKFKDSNYLEKKVKEEKLYFKALNDLLIKNNLKEKYISYLDNIEAEINFFNHYYFSYINKEYSNKRRFQNIFNIFNHTLIPFKLEKNESNINNNLQVEIDKLNNKLISIYSLNSFNKEEKITISKYEQHWLKPNNSVYVSIPLNEPFFASGGKGLFIYKNEVNPKKEEYKKHIVTLILEVKNINISTMIFLGNEKIISGGYQNGIHLIKFNDEYKNYNIIFHIENKQTIETIIRLNQCFLSYGENIPISKWKLNEAENNIEKISFLKPEKKIMNLCEISNKYFAYQTPEYIHIIYLNTFKEHLRIKYKINGIFHFNGITKFNDKIIAAISEDEYKLDFFDIETGNKVYEINGEDTMFKGFLKSKREKDETEIIAICEYCSGRAGYGFCLDFSLHNNNWIKLSKTSGTWTFYLRDISEMDDNTILISGQKELYVLFYP